MMTSSGWPRVSVIVPVRDAVFLRDCLGALEEQTYPGDGYEVVVVDNASPDPVAAIVDGFPHARVVTESRPGSYAARNHGIDMAHGNVLAFTDADCRPRADWLRVGVAAVTGNPAIGGVGGRVAVWGGPPEDLSLAALSEVSRAFPQQRYVEQCSFAVTANLFTRRDVVETIGPFRADLRSGGDREWGNRLTSRGYELRYEPHAEVMHPPRATWREVRTKLVRVIEGERDRTGTLEPLSLGRSLRQLAPPVRGIVRTWASQDWNLSTKVRYALAVTFARQLAVYCAIDVRRRQR